MTAVLLSHMEPVLPYEYTSGVNVQWVSMISFHINYFLIFQFYYFLILCLFLAHTTQVAVQMMAKKIPPTPATMLITNHRVWCEPTRAKHNTILDVSDVWRKAMLCSTFGVFLSDVTEKQGNY